MKMDHKRHYQNEQVKNNLYQFEMGNELGADIEEEKTMFKQEYCKDQISNNLNKVNEKHQNQSNQQSK